MMYITALSFGLVGSGLDIREGLAATSDKLLFSGGFLAALGWVSQSESLDSLCMDGVDTPIVHVHKKAFLTCEC